MPAPAAPAARSMPSTSAATPPRARAGGRSPAAVSGTVTGSAGGAAVGAITGFGLNGAVSYRADLGMAVYVELSNFDDIMQHDDVASTVSLQVDGAAGNDTLNVGKGAGSVAGIDGVLSFVGNGG